MKLIQGSRFGVVSRQWNIKCESTWMIQWELRVRRDVRVHGSSRLRVDLRVVRRERGNGKDHGMYCNIQDFARPTRGCQSSTPPLERIN